MINKLIESLFSKKITVFKLSILVIFACIAIILSYYTGMLTGKKEKGIKEEVCKIIKAHLERYDGSGFPSGLKWDEIPIGARIISVCADYIAGVRQRDMPNYEMVEYIYANSGVAYDPVIVAAFVNNVPIYPLGSLVQLSTGEIGIVVNIRKNKGPRPIVQVMFNRVYKPITSPYMVDMGQEKTVFIKKVISYV